MDQTLSDLKAVSWTASLPFKCHFCPETNIFNAALETEYAHFECIAVRARPTRWRKIKCSPSTLFGSVRLFTPLLVDLERILEAIVSSRI